MESVGQSDPTHRTLRVETMGPYLSEPILAAFTRILPGFYQDAGASAWDLKLASIQDGNMVP
jgi:hypothetical protein